MTPPKPPRNPDEKNAEKVEEILGWLNDFQNNIAQDYGMEDLHKIRRALTVMDKLRVARLAADLVRIGRLDDEDNRKIQRVMRLIPRVEKLFDAVERGLKRPLEEFGSYLPEEAKTQELADTLRGWGADRMARVVEANIPPTNAPESADRRRPVVSPRPMIAA